MCSVRAAGSLTIGSALGVVGTEGRSGDRDASGQLVAVTVDCRRRLQPELLDEDGEAAKGCHVEEVAS